MREVPFRGFRGIYKKEYDINFLIYLTVRAQDDKFAQRGEGWIAKIAVQPSPLLYLPVMQNIGKFSITNYLFLKVLLNQFQHINTDVF